ncbi:HDOD domain-containing protein [Planctomicrobium sp. SH661]|uniref:HDOD domain-containing protein n=1 Tax=Planctomicrobium sp. SH661 TaxID=3448124 RepID=UPI003F5BEC8A
MQHSVIEESGMGSAASDQTGQFELQSIAIPSLLLDRICGRFHRVQMLPAIAHQAMELMKDPDCTIRELTRIIEQDLKLAAEMLRIANSAAYCGNRPVATLTEATVRLGLTHCRNLILTASVASLIEAFATQEAWIQEVLWRHGMVTAVVAANLNRGLGTGFHGEEFTAGLMHDIGRILLAVAMPDRFLQGDSVDFYEDEQSLIREQYFFQTNHAEVGAWFSIGNNLPGCLTAAIRYHHSPSSAPTHQRLVSLIAVADEIANYIQRNESADGYEPTSNQSIDCLEASGVHGARLRFEMRADEILENSCRDALALCGS